MAMILAYITVPDLETGRRIGEALVAEGLATCVNLLPGMESIYRWQGKVERADELVLIAKLPADGFQALSDRVQALHPYQVPCIIALPITHGLPAYLAWLAGDGL
ncbi:divalent-cation tolerance protein CutA [Niveispirillum irakense]|uniref:divalent-cation tolerance protein CutA n=1 Tax=Niveispirillum irakense TaxID=34011 RepID=UPI0004191472|nr:divalent-cation tolerance protein CutA [Niveispirillum irakense]